jgi:CheY-like chemotaxis protein
MTAKASTLHTRECKLSRRGPYIRHMPDASSLDPRSSPAAPVAKRPLRVLIADDDRDNVLMLMEVLRDEGHDTKGVYDGDAVVDAVTLFKPDAVLLDIGMPQRTGYELARYLRKRFGENITLIAVTGWSKPSDKILATLAGFDHHIAKPYDPQALVQLLANLTPRLNP